VGRECAELAAHPVCAVALVFCPLRLRCWSLQCRALRYGMFAVRLPVSCLKVRLLMAMD
jgi:hypothetical protein